MFYKYKFFIVFTIFFILTSCDTDQAKDPEAFIRNSFAVLDTLQKECQSITDDLENVSLDTEENISKLRSCGKKLIEIASEALTYDLSKIENIEIRETITLLRIIEERYKLGEDLQQLRSNLMPIIKSYKEDIIRAYNDGDQIYTLQKIIEGNFITKTDDINDINYYWSHVADKVGKLTAENFFPFIDLIRKKAKEYNLSAAEFWYPNYSEETMRELDNFIKELKPSYQELHAFIRFKLIMHYDASVVKTHGPIPESLYQQIEDRIWSFKNHYEEDFPIDNIPYFKEVYEDRNINSKKLVEFAESFFTSLEFEKLDEKYWKDYIIAEGNKICTPTIDDKRPNNITMKYCDDVNFENFKSYHEFLGRMYVAGFQKDMHWLYWGNNFYGRIIGRAISLASATKKQQEILNLIPEYDISDKWMITDNVNMAFKEVFGLMRRYVNIRVITDLLENKIEKNDVNKHYWALFEEYAGVEPPVDRYDESLDLPYSLIRDLFDNTNLIRDFEVNVLGYDVYEAACCLAEHTGPLNECTFYSDKNVGKAFKKILSTGLRKPFKEAIKPLIPNYDKLNSKAILSYFEPTFTWMTRFNKEYQLKTGWDHTRKKLNVKPMTYEEEATAFVKESEKSIHQLYDQILSDLFNKKNEAGEFETDYYGNVYWKISKAAEAASDLTEISRKSRKYDNTKIKSESLKRAILKLAKIADIFVLGDHLDSYIYYKQQLRNLSKNGIAIYKDISDDPVTVAYNPVFLNIFKTSKDAKELEHYWNAWRDSNSVMARHHFFNIFQSFKAAAGILELSTTELWFKNYDTDYVQQMERVMNSLKPFYHRLHCYIYQNLLKKYSNADFSMSESLIPDHFIQQVLAQIWTNESIVEDDFPYNKLPPQEQGIADKKYDPLQLLKIAEEFYQSLGFEPLEESFWAERVKLEEDAANCDATIIDLTPKVYMKYCERVGFREFLQAHSHLGRLHYAVEKKNLPSYYFNSYDFEYPVGEAVILSAGSPKHIEKIGLISNFKVTDEVLLNRLIRMAIHTMLNLHKYFVYTKVINEFLEGKIIKEEINKYYWKYMITYAGIEPPNDRGDDVFDFPFEFYTDLDQNHHVRKFTAEVLGYRIYERLSELSGHEGVLSNCDFSDSIKVGNALKSMMKLGSSLPRNIVLKQLLQDDSILNANSMLNYYEPLEKWLKNKIKSEIPNAFLSKRRK